MRKITFKIATLCCIFLFAACEQTSFTINGKLVSRINLVYEGGRDNATYEYDNKNRITKLKYLDEYIIAFPLSWNYGYPNNKKIIIELDNYKDTINLNKDGTIKGTDVSGFTYENGYLKTGTRQDIINNYYYNSNYNWENGKLNEIIENQTRDNNFYIYTFTYEYGNINNKPCSIDLFWLVVSESYGHNAGRHGKVPDKLISSYTVVSTKNGNHVKTTNYAFTYETDTEGYITKIYRSIDGKPSELWFEIEYQN